MKAVYPYITIVSIEFLSLAHLVYMAQNMRRINKIPVDFEFQLVYNSTNRIDIF